MITYDVYVCIGTDDPNKRLAVKCHDTGVNLRVFLRTCRPGKWKDTFEPYRIPDGTTAVIRVTKPDKKYCITDGVVESGSVFFEMHPQAFTAAGVSKAEVSLFSENGKRITSATFYIDVPEECICGCDLESENYIDVMSEQIRAAIDAADRAEAAATHGPIIQNGTWWLWDFEKGAYVDSGVKASSESGSNTLVVTFTPNWEEVYDPDTETTEEQIVNYTADMDYWDIATAFAEGTGVIARWSDDGGVTWNVACGGYADQEMPHGKVGPFMHDGIVDEDWHYVAESSGSGGTGLPPVTAEDNGKFLGVVNGKWAAASLPVYDGTYEITPNAYEGYTLSTAQTYMEADIKISKIPYSEVSNNSGGTTANIGG